MNKFIVVAVVVFLALNVQAADGSGLQMSLAGDMVFNHPLKSGSLADDKLTMRGVEVLFYGPVDHRFEGALSAAAHDSNGEVAFELHELYLASSKLLPNSRFKVGQFFLGIGRLNQIHQHDWPFIRAPKVHETFFDKEGVFDSGFEYGYLLPTDSYWDLTLGVTSGYIWGHAHNTSGLKPETPTHYVRLETFREFSSTDGMKIGLNYIGRTDEQKKNTVLSGVDFIAKWREGKRIVYLLQSEAWQSLVKDASGTESRQAGLYIFNQFGLTESLLLGFRADGFKDLTKKSSVTNLKLNNISYTFASELTWKSSEFATVRTGFSHGWTREEGVTKEEDLRFELQFVFMMGAHPAHSF